MPLDEPSCNCEKCKAAEQEYLLRLANEYGFDTIAEYEQYLEYLEYLAEFRAWNSM